MDAQRLRSLLARPKDATGTLHVALMAKALTSRVRANQHNAARGIHAAKEAATSAHHL